MKRLRSIFVTSFRPQNPIFQSQNPSNPTFSNPIRPQAIHILTQRANSYPPNGRPWNHSSFARESTSTFTPTEKVSSIVDEISGLTLLEVADLTDLVRQKLGVEEMPVMTMMMPGMGFSVKGGAKGGGAKAEEKVVEKTAFDLKLEGFDAAAKIKVIKEVRTFTDLGLKEAKDLVEKAPTLLKKGVTKEEGQKIIEKLKELGAKVVME